MQSQPSRSARIQADKIDALFARWDKPDSPGCALGIIHDGELVYARGYGLANLEHSVPITPATVFDIASTAKQVTALCIALLAEQGILSLDDDVRDHVPELPDYGHTITIRHLLHHTSGLRDHLECALLAGYCEQDYLSDDELFALVTHQRALNFVPGEDYVYSNTGYTLMARIIHRTTGQTLRQYAHERVFQPLGMRNTLFFDDHNEVVRNRADGHSPKAGGGYRRDMYSLDEVGDGGLLTTMEDLLLWDRNFYDNALGEGRMGLVQQMEVPGRLNSGEETDYGFGLFVSTYKGMKTISHGGHGGGYRSEMIRFPDQSLTVICLANLSSLYPEPLALQVASLCLGLADEEMADPVSLSAADLADKVGIYRNPDTGRMLELSLQEGQLMLGIFGYTFQTTALSPTRFRAQEAPVSIEVTMEKQEQTWHVGLLTDVTRPETLQAIEIVSPGADRLAEYVGTYTSDELRATHELLLQDGKLCIKYRYAVQGVLRPGSSDMFVLGPATFLFERDGQGRVSGYTASVERARNIRFGQRAESA